MVDDSTEQWLSALPLDELVDIDGESVFLRVQPDGAELGVRLLGRATDANLADALRTSFQGALEFDAGLGWEQEGGALVLTQWLAGVASWSEVPEALENILNQASLWRAAMAPAAARRDHNHSTRRAEERFRKLLFEG